MSQDRNSFDNPTTMPPGISHRIPTIRCIAMPADANPHGDIFGGWILAQMDLAGGAHAYKFLEQRVVTVGVEAMSFKKPVFIGDEVSFYTRVSRIGTTSISIDIESWAFRRQGGGYAHVTEGVFTYVMLDEMHRPAPIPASLKKELK